MDLRDKRMPIWLLYRTILVELSPSKFAQILYSDIRYTTIYYFGT